MRLFSWFGKLFSKRDPNGFLTSDDVTRLLRKKFGGEWIFDSCNKRWSCERAILVYDIVRRAPGSYRQFVLRPFRGEDTEFTL
jgi:hypothetical protein